MFICMDTKKDSKIPKYGDLEGLHRKKIVVGTKQLRKAVLGGHASFVYLAINADPAITEPLEEMCRNNGIRVTWVSSMADLGRACGIEVGAAAAAVVN